MTILSKDNIAKVANEILRKNKIRKPPIPVEKIARNLGAEVRYIPYEGDLSGMVFRDEEEDRYIIGVNSLHHPNRQRFTIAHELGHLCFHKGKEIYIDRAYRVNLRSKISSQAVDKEEIEANRFAAALLMPEDMLKKDLSRSEIDLENEGNLKKLAKKYKVSLQSFTFRVINIFGPFE